MRPAQRLTGPRGSRQSGYQPDRRPALELYRNDPEEHPEKKPVVDICVPVRPL